MNERGKSDSLIVPGKLPNKGCGALRPAEEVEGRGLAKGNPDQQTRSRTQSLRDLQHALERIRWTICGLRVITRGRSHAMA
jgi:hypothetical protein